MFAWIKRQWFCWRCAYRGYGPCCFDIRDQLREGNKLAREAAIKRGVGLHPRIAAMREYSSLPPEKT